MYAEQHLYQGKKLDLQKGPLLFLDICCTLSNCYLLVIPKQSHLPEWILIHSSSHKTFDQKPLT